MKLRIMKGSENLPLFDKINEKLNRHLGKIWKFGDVSYNPMLKTTSLVFSNDNIKFKVEESVRGDDVFIIQPNYPDQNERIMELLIMIDTLKHASAGRITVILPYYPYCRSDKRGESRTSITARLLADLLQTAGADRAMFMHLHSPQTQGFFRIPTDHLVPREILYQYLKDKVVFNKTSLVAPDAGSSKMVTEYAEMCQLPVAYMSKIRVDDTENPQITSLVGHVKDRICIILDDEIASGKSMIKAAEVLKLNGAKEIHACAIHGILTKDAIGEMKKSPISKVHVTNTVWRPGVDYMDEFIQTIDVSSMFVDAIKRIHYE
jgi:ribose-phosphate pyrophosphokinase